jgi:hypothetical protein
VKASAEVENNSEIGSAESICFKIAMFSATAVNAVSSYTSSEYALNNATRDPRTAINLPSKALFAPLIFDECARSTGPYIGSYVIYWFSLLLGAIDKV